LVVSCVPWTGWTWGLPCFLASSAMYLRKPGEISTA